MKKIIIVLLTCIMVFIPFHSYALNYIAVKATFPVYIDGQMWNTTNPILAIDGSTYLPLKAVGEALGINVSWNSEAFRVDINTKSKPYGITPYTKQVSDSYIASTALFDIYIDGSKWNTTKPIMAIDGSTYLPLKAIGDALGINVVWNSQLSRVEINTAYKTSNVNTTKTFKENAKVLENVFLALDLFIEGYDNFLDEITVYGDSIDSREKLQIHILAAADALSICSAVPEYGFDANLVNGFIESMYVQLIKAENVSVYSDDFYQVIYDIYVNTNEIFNQLNSVIEQFETYDLNEDIIFPYTGNVSYLTDRAIKVTNYELRIDGSGKTIFECDITNISKQKGDLSGTINCYATYKWNDNSSGNFYKKYEFSDLGPGETIHLCEEFNPKPGYSLYISGYSIYVDQNIYLVGLDEDELYDYDMELLYEEVDYDYIYDRLDYNFEIDTDERRELSFRITAYDGYGDVVLKDEYEETIRSTKSEYSVTITRDKNKADQISRVVIDRINIDE